MEYLKLHQANEHSEHLPQVGGQAASVKPRAEKVPMPQIKLGVSQDEFSYFQDEWTSYKRSSGITDETETRDQLRAACNEDLRKNLFNCLGSKLKTLTEQEMMDEIKKLAVLAQNNLVKMVQFFELSQDREEPIRAFFARLKAAASACKLTVQCTAVACTERVSYSDKMILHALVRGIVDEEIRENVLAKTEELGLEETIKFIEAKETGRRSTAQLSPGGLANTGVNKITAYKREQRSDAITRPTLIPMARPTGTYCTHCKQTDHGSSAAIREKKCPAFNKSCTRCHKMGHFSLVCHKPRVKADGVQQNQRGDQDAPQVLSIQSYSPLISLVDSQGNKHVPSFGDKIPHMVDNNGELEIATPEPQPRIDVEIQVDIAAYKQFGMECKLGNQITDRRGRLFEPPKTSTVTDTGAQVDCLNKSKLKYLGLNESSLLQTVLH